MDKFCKRTWAEVDLRALGENYDTLKAAAGEKGVICVVKANAYGHGDLRCAEFLERRGAAMFTVACADEAKRLREGGVKGEILIFGYTDIGFAVENAGSGYLFTVGSVEYAEALSAAAEKAGVTVPAHIKADTGMSRVGVTTRAEVERILALPGLCCRAGYTHFAVADSLGEDEGAFTDAQQKRAAELFAGTGLKLHTQNSAGIVLHRDYGGDFVRAGICLYGCRPDTALPPVEGIRPVMRVKSAVCELKRIAAGTTVSYGRTFTAERDTLLALIPCGYADGFNRRLSGRWSCTVRGASAPVRGRICMDQTLIDVTDIPGVEIGDEVTVFSDKGENTFEAAADLIGTISYELLCAISPRVPRVYIE